MLGPAQGCPGARPEWDHRTAAVEMGGMEADAVDGWWWLPGHNDEAQFGRLSAPASGSWTLDLYGGLDREESPLGTWFSGETVTVPAIHGHLLNGAPAPRFVSLFNCWQTKANRTIGGPVPSARTESWTFQEVVVGHDNVSPDERVVEIHVRLSSLVAWTGRKPPVVDQNDRTTTVSATAVDLGSADVSGATVDLVLDHTATASTVEAAIRHDAMFRVAPHEPISFSAAMSEFAVPLQSLLSFLTLGHVAVEKVAVRLEEDADERWPSWLDYRTRLPRPFEEPRRPDRHEMLAAWPDIADMTVEGLVAGWFKLREHRQVEKAITLLLAPTHAPYLYTDDHLLTAFVAIEAYHDARIGGTAVDARQHEERVDAIIAAAPVEHQAWAKDMLRSRNQKGQRRKLKDLIEQAGTTGEAVKASLPGFVDLAAQRRGSVAHPSTSARVRGEEHLAISYGLRWLLRHCLLVDLGLSQERAADLIARCKRFSDEIALAKKWIAAG